MYQVEKVHKQKSIELKKRALEFCFFFSSNEGGGNYQRKSNKKLFGQTEGQTMDPNLVLVLPQRSRHRKVQRHCH